MDIDDYSKLPIYKCIACDKNLKINLNEPYINWDNGDWGLGSIPNPHLILLFILK